MRFQPLSQLITLLVVLLLPSWGETAGKDVSLSYNGIELNAHFLKSPETAHKDVAFLMVHGTLAHNRMEMIASTQSLLEEAGWNSLAINLSLGISNRHGSYKCEHPHRHTHEEAVGEISAWVQWLKHQGIRKIVLLGHSRGGSQVAWYLTEQVDPVIRGAVLVAPSTWSMKKAMLSYKERFNGDLMTWLGKALLFSKQSVSRDALIQPPGFIYCKDAKVTPRSFVSYYKADPRKDTPNLLKHIAVPTLIAVGSEDRVVADLLPTLQSSKLSKNFKLSIIDGAGHFFPDLDGDTLAEEIVNFVDPLFTQ
ncbi:alpha/beta hydrolase [Magnetococcus sp. PR-3]|uniref:alpha/beta hydrolase n=1 Tax=Magnetococcus sp. PR-3 TaxID=3120355 RepID=UPI002FCE6887